MENDINKDLQDENTYLKVKVESLDSKIHELESENKQRKICNEALKKCLKEVL